ncbi:MAG: hypothetical protein M1831_003452 [Alyxoria varia]|nr:MAG: hypothetical protein M1831_003452 [Alyxoria varia]
MSSLKAADLFGVENLVVVITGGGTGLGLMAAKALDANGAAAVYIIGRRQEELEAAAKEGKNGSIIPLVGDVTSKDSLKSVAEQVRQRHGYMNALLANAGVAGVTTFDKLPLDSDPSIKDFVDKMWEPSMEDFTQAMHVNVTAVFYTALAFLELLGAGNKSGNVCQKSQIVVTSSIGAFARVPAAGYAYSASKAGVNTITKQMATKLAPYMIRVNAICPGIFPSELIQRLYPVGKPPIDEGSVPVDRIPMTRFGREEDMAGAVLHLMSPAGGYVDGALQILDGGRLGLGPSSY